MEELQGNVSEEVVSPQETNVESTQEITSESSNVESNTVESEKGEVANHQTDEVRSQQSAEENSRYAKLRREAEDKGRDLAIREMQLEWNGKPINTYKEYQQALKEQKLVEQATEQGIDPAFYTQFKTMQEELNGYKQEKMFSEQERELANDPVKGEFFKEWKNDIVETATQYGVDLRTAFTVHLENKLPEILSSREKKIKNETINKIHQNGTSSPGKLGQGDSGNASVNAWDMSKSDFDKMVKKALNGELKQY